MVQSIVTANPRKYVMYVGSILTRSETNAKRGMLGRVACRSSTKQDEKSHGVNDTDTLCMTWLC
jgi:hypothetical protein